MIDRPLGRPSDYRRRYSTRGVKQPPKPVPVPGAEWQAGVTPDSERFRVLLDGEPCPLAFAASARGGWVIAFLDAVAVYDDERAGAVAYRIPREIADTNPATGNAAGHRTLRGDVRIVADC